MWRVIFLFALIAFEPCAQAQGQSDVAYLAVSDGLWQVWVMNHDGKNARQVTRSLSDKVRVSWLPQGDRLLVDSNQGTVKVVDIQSGKESPLDLGVAPVLDAVMSPDGSHVAFSFNGAESRDGNDIWVAGSDGKNRKRLTDMPGLQHDPVWSPDGSAIYFLSSDSREAHNIWKLDLSSGNREQLTAANLFHFDIAVSSNGVRAFSSNRSGRYEIYLERLNQAPVAITKDADFNGHPAFSPDGRILLFDSSHSGVLEIWSFDLNMERSTQITHWKAGARAPVWRTVAAGAATK